MPSCNTSPGITSNPSGTSGGLKERRSWLRSNEPGRQPLAKIKLSLLFKRRMTRLRRYAPQLRMGVLPLVHIQLNPGRRVVAGMGSVADPTIDAGLSQARRQFGVKQQMIDAQSRILLPMLTEIVPEGVDAFLWIASAHGIGPSLSKQALIALAAFGL